MNAQQTKRLSPRQRLFCEEFLIDLNGAGAARRSGYAPNVARQQATKLLKNPAIKNYLECAVETKCDKAGVSAEWVLKNIKQTIDKCQQNYLPSLDSNGHPLTIVDNQGEVVHLLEFDAVNALKGLELLCKYLSLFQGNEKQSR